MDDKVLRSEDHEKVLLHIGVLERSGRFPWGSGEHPFQRLKDWQGYVKQLRREGLTDEEIAKGSGMTLEEFKDSLISTTQKRSQTTVRNAQEKVANVARAWELKNKGYSQTAIAEVMGVSEGTIRNWLKPGADAKAKEIVAISDKFRESVDEKGFIDCGVDVNRYLGVSKTKMDACVALLKEEGYNIYWVKTKQLGTGKDTTVKVLAPPDVGYKEFMEAYKNDPSIVKTIGYCADDETGGLRPIGKPTSISRDRIFVRYSDDPEISGNERDGVIQLRPGVEDLDLMDTRYAQVRIAVDDKMYMKGMAVYSKDIPDGYDVVYNVNKPSGTADSDVFKKMYKKGEDDPFGASTTVKYLDEETGEIMYQKDYIGSDGKRHQSALNIVNDQGEWGEWSKTLASQMLSKQSPDLAKKQLGIVAESRSDELKEILEYNNPTIRKKMLEEYAEACDSDAVHLKAAALPRQAAQVIIPIPSLKDNEIYAPNYNDGETVVLIRYPHAGTFEAPQLKVNNKNKEGQDVIGKSGKGLDAVGINATVAQQLSGADFDGDSVLVIPNNDGKVKVSAPLADLKKFDPKISYPLSDDHPINTLDSGSAAYKKLEAKLETEKQRQMGIVSNLITDMTIQGADQSELARAVKHSMVVIDSAKHHLDWRQSEKDNNIQELKNKYQPKDDGKPGGGSSTLISRAKSEERINERKELTSPRLMTEQEKKDWEAGLKVPNSMTKKELEAWKRGEKIYRETGRTKMVKVGDEWVDSGKKVTQKTTKMALAKDARELSSGTAMEEIYVEHANALKALANQARAEARKTPKLQYSPSAKQTYAAEVASLDKKLDDAKKNAPLERQAMLIANAMVKAKIRDNPSIEADADSKKKVENKCLSQARTRVGANKKSVQVQITDKEWDAIQAGAISDSKLQDILKNTDMDAVKKRATPRASTGLSSTQIARAKSMSSRGLTQAEIAEALGVSTSTISVAIATK